MRKQSKHGLDRHIPSTRSHKKLHDIVITAVIHIHKTRNKNNGCNSTNDQSFSQNNSFHQTQQVLHFHQQHTANMGNSASASFPPLKPVVNCETARFMGTWFVIAVKPTVFEKTCSNAVENYTLVSDDKKSKHDVAIDFQYNAKDPISSPLKSLPQRGFIQGKDKSNTGDWKVSPFGPIRMPYTIIEVDDKDYDYCVIGYPNRAYCWIMSRKPQMEESTYNMLTDKLVKDHQYSLDGLRKVPQKWTAEERTKRGLDSAIPDSMLVTEGAMN